MNEARLPGWPRGLSDALAAAYVGLGQTMFREAMASAGIKPTWLTKRRRVWDIRALDAWLDARANDAPMLPRQAQHAPAASSSWDGV
jgi:hypothetical protein